MNARWMTLWSSLAGLAGLAVLAVIVFMPDGALAQCCAPPTPPCCKPPSPPPPSRPCCGSGGPQINVPGVNVVVGASVVVNAAASANVNASASGGGAVIVYGGRGSSFSMGSGPVSVIQGLNVEGGRRQRSAYSASRTRIKVVVIQAFCLDDRDVPHPASQVTPDRDIDETYRGELYRCIAGTRMQYTVADYGGKIAFDHGQTMTCAKGDALAYSPWTGQRPVGPDSGPPGPGPGGLECRPQKPARDCNERSLLRRFGAGVKILRIITTQTDTAYREEQSEQASTSSMTVDGGVGGVAY